MAKTIEQVAAMAREAFPAMHVEVRDSALGYQHEGDGRCHAWAFTDPGNIPEHIAETVVPFIRKWRGD